MKYLGRVEDSKDATNKGYVDSGLASKVPTSDYAPVTKTADMTQAVGKDAEGKLWTEPGVITVTVTGTTPSITAEANHRYVCGEVSTLCVTLPASGIVDVTFESGATPTVLTITPPTGVTMKWANGFDPTSLEANTTYELLCNGILGLAHFWHNTPSMRTRLETIADITTEQELRTVVINKDINNNDFALSYAEVYVVLPVNTPAGTWYSYFSNQAQRFVTVFISSVSGTVPIFIKQSLDVVTPFGLSFIRHQNYSTSYGGFMNDSQGPISLYRITNFSSLLLPVGSRFVLLGIRQ